MAEKELPDYLKKVDKTLLQKKETKKAQVKAEHPVKHAAKRAAHHVKEAVRNIKHGKRPAQKRKSLGETWDELTEGPIGTVVYIILGFLIAMAVNEGLKPILLTDMPVVAVFSESMVPTFEKGDLIIVQGGVPIKQGDIVVYDAPVYKYPIIHRVMSTSAEGITTKGDHNSAADPWLTPVSKVHGKAVMRIPYLGWVKVGSYEIMGLV